jgi:hypothetical protein
MRISKDNRWVKLDDNIPWAEIGRLYNFNCKNSQILKLLRELLRVLIRMMKIAEYSCIQYVKFGNGSRLVAEYVVLTT